MFTKVLILSTALLVLATYTTNAVAMNCGEMTSADCKKEFAMEMDKKVKMKFTELMKDHMMKMMDFYTAVKNDMPADGMHAKTLKKTVDDIKVIIEMIDKMNGMSIDEMQHTMQRAFISVQPDFTKAQVEDSANSEHFNEMMDKHGFTKEMPTELLMTMMKEFERIWMEIYDDLRPQDIKDFPKYTELNDEMKRMKEATSRPDKLGEFIYVLAIMMDFNETPFMTATMHMLTMNA